MNTNSSVFKMAISPLIFVYTNAASLLLFIYLDLHWENLLPLVILNVVLFYDIFTRKHSYEKDAFSKPFLIISFLLFPLVICFPFLEYMLLKLNSINRIVLVLGMLAELLGGLCVIVSRKKLGKYGSVDIVIEKDH